MRYLKSTYNGKLKLKIVKYKICFTEPHPFRLELYCFTLVSPVPWWEEKIAKKAKFRDKI